MAERRSFKSINFDLDTKALKQYYDKSWRNAYKEIKNFLKDNGFEHRQWSGYVSKNKMNAMDISFLNKEMWKKFPWLEQCAKQIDVTDVGNKFDLVKLHEEQNGKSHSLEKTDRVESDKVSSKPSMSMSGWQQAMKTQGDMSHAIENPTRAMEKPLEREG